MSRVYMQVIAFRELSLQTTESIPLSCQLTKPGVREVEEGGGETTVVNAAGDERGPGDDGARVGEWENELSWVGKVEFGVHIDEVVAEEGGERGVMGSEDVRVDGTAEEGGAT